MIEIKGVTKIYNSKKKHNCKALDNIDLNLPNHGLVFVIGKSGSGKSTLLNLIGGLDSLTSGQIIVDGNDISLLKEHQFSNYRNNHVGFIFQDYHLIDDLTVYENIKLTINLRGVEETGQVKEALEKVGLSGYENRFPYELSGGERQRVAIARAIVKHPHIILADEPTGNLDQKTATSIVELLKEISKECLILTVSHNKSDAHKFADRIIELSNGHIIGDHSLNLEYNNELEVKGDTLYYPKHKSLSDEDIEYVNKELENKNIKHIVKTEDKFIDTVPSNEQLEKVVFDKKDLSFKNSWELSLKFLRHEVLRIFLSSFMVSVIMIIFSLSETIILFDSSEVLQNEMLKMNQETVFVEKVLTEDQELHLDRQYRVAMTESDLEKVRSIEFEGKYYEVLNYSISSTSATNFSGIYSQPFRNNFYIAETLGTMIVDEAFLEKTFGKLEYVARLDEFSPTGIIITDYIADSILLLNKTYANRTYEDILGKYYLNNTTAQRGYINAIIKTDYLEKFGPFMDSLKSLKSFTLAEVYENQDFFIYSNDVFAKLGFTYSLNPNFLEDTFKNPSYKIAYHHKINFNNVYDYYGVSNNFIAPLSETRLKIDLEDNEVVMNYAKYNEIFNTNYDSKQLDEFIPHSIKIKQYYFSDINNENVLLEKELKVVQLTSSSSGLFVVSENLYLEFYRNTIYTQGIYFDNIEDIAPIVELCDELNLEQKSYIIDGIQTMSRAVEVFVNIFQLVALVLCLGVIFILVNFAVKIIKDKYHEIGILKALGSKDATVTLIFGLQIGLIAAFTILMSTIGYFLFIDLANDVLVVSLKKLATSRVVLDLQFLSFKSSVALVNVGLILLFSLVSLVVPLFTIRKIKPVKIIKTKE